MTNPSESPRDSTVRVDQDLVTIVFVTIVNFRSCVCSISPGMTRMHVCQPTPAVVRVREDNNIGHEAHHPRAPGGAFGGRGIGQRDCEGFLQEKTHRGSGRGRQRGRRRESGGGRARGSSGAAARTCRGRQVLSGPCRADAPHRGMESERGRGRGRERKRESEAERQRQREGERAVSRSWRAK